MSMLRHGQNSRAFTVTCFNAWVGLDPLLSPTDILEGQGMGNNASEQKITPNATSDLQKR